MGANRVRAAYSAIDHPVLDSVGRGEDEKLDVSRRLILHPSQPGVLLQMFTEATLLGVVAAGPLEGAFAIGASGISLVKLAGALCFLSFVMLVLLTNRRIVLDGSHRLLLLFLSVALASSLHADSWSDAVTVTIRYASFVTLYLVITQIGRDAVVLPRVAWVLSLSSALASAIALERFWTGTDFRATLAHTDPNDFAFLLVTTLPLTLWLLGSVKRSLRPAVTLMVLVMSLAAVLTFSRGAFVASLGGTAWLLLVERRYARRALAALVAAVVVVVAASHLEPARFSISVAAKQRVAGENVATRLEAWRAAGDLALDNAILGVGPGNYHLHYIDATGRPRGTKVLLVPHDAYLDVAAELGLTGLCLFTGFLIMAMGRFRMAVRWRSGPPGFAIAAQTAFIMALLGSVFLSVQYYAPVWLLAGLATCLCQSRQQVTLDVARLQES